MSVEQTNNSPGNSIWNLSFITVTICRGSLLRHAASDLVFACLSHQMLPVTRMSTFHTLHVEKMRIQGALRSSALLEAQDSPQGLKILGQFGLMIEGRLQHVVAWRSYFLGLFYISLHNLMHLQKKIPSFVTNFYVNVHSMADTILFLVPSTVLLPELSSVTSTISCPM